MLARNALKSLLFLTATLAASTFALDTAFAATKYWDLNGATAGAGTTPTGTWDNVTSNWSTASAGNIATTTFTNGFTDPDVFFSAGADATGTYTVTVSGTQQINNLTVEEGTPTFSGGTLQFGSPGGGPNVTVNAGLTAAINSAISRAGSGQVYFTKRGTGSLQLGGASGAQQGLAVYQGTLEITGGNLSFANDTYIGSTGGASCCSTTDVNGNGTLLVSGGSLTIGGSNFIMGQTLNGATKVAQFTQTGGTVSVTSGFIGIANGTGVSQLDITGGSFTTSASMNLGVRGASTLNIGGNATVTMPGLIFGHGSTAGANNLTNLNGGTLIVGSVSEGSGTSTFVFNGGTLRASASSATFMQGLDTARVDSNSTIDTQAFQITIAQALLVGSGGGLTKNGTGDLTLSGANTYSGGTQVNGGRIVAGSGNIGTGAVTVASGAELFLTGGTHNNTFNISGDGGTLSAIDTQLRGALRIEGGTIGASGSVVMQADSSIGAYGGATGTVNAVISESGGARSLTINKSSASTPGTIVLGGANTYSGDTIVANGTLRLGANNVIPNGAGKGNVSLSGSLDLNNKSDTINGLSGSGTVTSGVAGAASLTIGDNNATSTFGGIIQNGSGTVSLTKMGTGTLTLTGANTYSGGTTINASSGTLNATVNSAQNALGTGAVSVGANSTLFLNNTETGAGANTAISNTFTGTGLIQLNFAAGTNARGTTLGNVNGFNGTIELSASGATGDKWNATGINAPSATVQVDNSAQLFVSGADTFGAVKIIGTGNNEARGAIRLASTLNAPVTVLGNATIGAEGGVINGTISTGVAGLSTLTLGTANSNTFATNMLNGVISDGTGTLALAVFNQNSGNVFISGAANNTYSGGTTLLNSSSGTRLVVGAVSGTPYGSGPINIGQINSDRAGIYFTTAGQTLANAIVFNTELGTDRPGIRADATNITLSGQITANNSNALFSTNGTGSFNLTGKVTGNNGLTLDNAFGTSITVTLSNAAQNNDYAGTTSIESGAGVLVLGANNQIPNGAGKGNVQLDGQLNLNGKSDTINGLNGSGTLTSGVAGAASLTVGDNNTTSTFGGIIQNGTGTVSLTKIGTGTLTLTGANTYSGGTTINASSGTLNVTVNAAQNSLGTGAVSVGSGSTLYLNNTETAGTTTISNTMTGSGLIQLNFAAGAAARNTGMANVTGFTGTIELSNSGATGDKWNAGGINAPNATVQVDSGSQLFVSGADTFSLVKIVGTGNTENRGAIRLPSTLNATVSLQGNATIGNEGGSITGGISTGVAGTSTLTMGTSNSNGAATLSGAITDGTGTLALTTAFGTTTLSNSGNSYSGATTVNGGSTLQLGANNVIPNGVGKADVALAGTLDLNNKSDTINGLTGAGTVTSSVAGAASLTVGDNNTTSTFGGIIQNGSGTVSLTKMGSGTLTLTNTNTHTGGTTISGGSLTTGVAGGLSTGAVANNATLNLTGGAVTYTFGNLSGNGVTNITLGSGSGATQFASATWSGYTGTLNVGVSQAAGSGKALINNALGAGATVNVNSNSTLYSSAAVTHNAAATLFGGDTGESIGQLRLDSGAIWAGSVTLAGNMASGDNTVGTQFGTGTISGNIGESGGARALTKGGSATLVLSGNNSYSGGTFVNEGTLQVNSDAALGSTSVLNPVTLNTGTLTSGAANITLNANHKIIVAAAGGTINAGSTGNVNFIMNSADMLQGSGTLTITGGSQTTTVLQVNDAQPNFSGNINITSGRINLNNAAATLGTGTITVGTGTASLYLSQPATLANNIQIQSNGGEGRGAVRFQNGGTVNGNITLLNNAGLSSESAATPTNLNGNITGAFALQLGGLTGSNAGATYNLAGPASSIASMNLSGLVNLTGGLTTTGDIQVTTGSFVIQPGANLHVGDGLYTGNTGLNGSITQNGGTIVVDGDSWFSNNGGVSTETFSGGTYTSNSTTTIGTRGNSTVTVNGGTVWLKGDVLLGHTADTTTTVTAIDLSSGSLTIGNAGTGQFILGQSDQNGSTSTFTQTGGTFVFNGSNLYMGNFGQPLSTQTVSVSAGTFTSNTADMLLAIRGTASLNISGTGIVTLPGLSYGHPGTSGSTGNVNLGPGGTLVIGANGIYESAGADTSNFNFNGGTLKASASFAMGGLNSAPVNSTSTIDTQGFAISISQPLTVGTGGGLIKNGIGDLGFTGANTYSGGTQINAGRLSVSGAGTFGTGPVTVASGAQAYLVAGTHNNVFNISGDGGNSLDPQLRGAIRFEGGNLGATSSVVLQADASLGAYFGTTGTVGGVISESGGARALSINKSATAAPGTIVLSAANTFSGDTRVYNGTLRLANILALQNSTLDMNAADNGAVSFGTLTSATLGGLKGSRNLSLSNTTPAAVAVSVGNNNQSTTYSGVLSGLGSVNKIGTGTLTLTNANTYSGATNVSGGTLELATGGSLAGTSSVTVGNSGSGTGDRLLLNNPNAHTLGQGDLIVGNTEAGVVDHNVGNVTVGDNDAGLENVRIGVGASGTYNIGGSGPATLNVGDNGSGNVSGGRGVLTVGDAGGSTGTLNVHNGATVNTGDLKVGNGAAGGTVNQDGGTINVLNSATYTLNASDAPSLTATTNQSGGTTNVTGGMVLGNGVGAATQNRYNLSGGVLDFGDSIGATQHWGAGTNPASTMTINSDAQFNFTGGTLRDVTTINANGGAGTFTQSGGNFYVGQDEGPSGYAQETTINGGYSLLAGVLNLDVFGADPTPDQCCDGTATLNDQLSVQGTALLNSTVSLDFENYDPQFGDIFTLVCAEEITLDDGFHIDGGYFRLVPTGNGDFPFALQAIVPEPASVAVWTMIGLAGAAAAFRMRKRGFRV